MKKRTLILALASAAILALGGCSSSEAAVQTVASEKPAVESQEAATQEESTGAEAALKDDRTNTAGAQNEDISDADSQSSAGNEDAGNTDANNTDDNNAIESLKTYLKEMKANHNQDPVNLTATVGEFAYWDDDEMDLIEDSNAETYGFWEDLTSGCSVWCAVNGFTISAEASSVLAPQGKQDYKAENILSGSRSDAWVEGVEGYGVGESISITKSYDTASGELVPDEESVFFYEMCIVNGLARTDKAWKENSRVKTLKFYFNGYYQGDIELEDTMKPQYISLSGLELAAKNNEENTFTFQIADIYPGSKYEDTAITGIEIAIDSPNH